MIRYCQMNHSIWREADYFYIDKEGKKRAFCQSHAKFLELEKSVESPFHRRTGSCPACESHFRTLTAKEGFENNGTGHFRCSDF